MGDVGINHALHEYTALRDGVRGSEVMVGGKKMPVGRIAFLQICYGKASFIDSLKRAKE